MYILVVSNDYENLSWVNSQFIDPCLGPVSINICVLGEALRLVKLVKFDMIVFDSLLIDKNYSAKIEEIISCTDGSQCYFLLNNHASETVMQAMGISKAEYMVIEKINPFILTDFLKMYEIEKTTLKRNIA